MAKPTFFNRLKLSHKLTLIGVTLGVPVLVLAYFLVTHVEDDSRFLRQELRGLEYLNKISPLLSQVIQHNSASQTLVRGEASFRDLKSSSAAGIETALADLEVVEKKQGANLQTAKEFDKVKTAWSELKNRSLNATPEDVMASHQKLILAIFDLSGRVGDVSNLIYDPVNVTYALQDNIVYRVPLLVEAFSDLRSTTLAVAVTKKLTPELRDRISYAKGKIELARQAIKTNYDLIAQYDPQAREKLQTAFDNSIVAVDQYLKLVDQDILKPAAVSITSQDLWASSTPAVDGLLGAKSYNDLSVPVLEQLLTTRLDTSNRTLYGAIIAIIIGAALSTLLVVYLVRMINGQVQSLIHTFDSIQTGNYESRAEIRSADELGRVAQSLNTMLDNTVTLIQSKDERDSIQGSIMKLLEDVSGVAEGDLTKHAEVTADVTGAIADSFNYMIDQLRRIISDVQKATLQVTRSASEIFGTAQNLAKGAEQQAAQIIGTSTSVEDMSQSIRQVSENAEVSASVAQQALVSAQAGNNAVRNTIAGMNRIRDQVQETAKRIKRLGESSQEIGQIIQLIEDIADRTSILALNASIQAAMAGDAGRGFAVVAEEVERLADRSTDATKKIGTLVRTIQSETNEAVNAMEKGIQEVVEGSRLASSAGQALVEIETVSNRLADLIQTITKASRQQAKASEGVVRTMTDISETTQRTASGTRTAASAVNQLASLADRLRASVASFRLPVQTNEHDLSGMLARGARLESKLLESRSSSGLISNPSGVEVHDLDMTGKSNEEIMLGRF
jgi:twitching motility protein PilJ